MTDATPPPAVAPPRLTALRRGVNNLGWLLASRGVLGVLSLVYLGIATRALGVVDFGRFALITGAAQALALCIGFQTWQIVVQYGVAHLLADNRPALGRLLRACALLDLASAFVGAALAVAIIELFGEHLGIGPDLKHYVLLYTLVQFVTLRSTPLGILRLRDKFSLAALADSVMPAVRLVGALFALAFLPTIKGFLIAWAAAEVFTAAAYWLIAARLGDLGLLWRSRARRGPLFAENPHLVRFSASTNANSTLGLAGKQLPVLLVGAFIGPAAAGAFRLAFQLAQALGKLSQLFARAAFTEIVRAARTVGAARLRGALGKLFLSSSAAALVVMAIVVVAGRPMLVLVGGEVYADAYPLLLWLAAAGCLDLAAVSFEPMLMAVHRAGIAFAAHALATIVLLAAMLLLTPAHGAIGTSAAVLLGSLATTILLGAATLRFVRPGEARTLPQGR
jgi:O-antigen/teichoic acid export membrane protein